MLGLFLFLFLFCSAYDFLFVIFFVHLYRQQYYYHLYYIPSQSLSISYTSDNCLYYMEQISIAWLNTNNANNMWPCTQWSNQSQMSWYFRPNFQYTLAINIAFYAMLSLVSFTDYRFIISKIHSCNLNV